VAAAHSMIGVKRNRIFPKHSPGHADIGPLAARKVHSPNFRVGDRKDQAEPVEGSTLEFQQSP
jgi:hypothetical protein